jgi:hypothetical protein
MDSKQDELVGVMRDYLAARLERVMDKAIA